MVGTSVSPFNRYVSPFGGFGLSPFGRDIGLGGPLHDPWRTYVVFLVSLKYITNRIYFDLTEPLYIEECLLTIR